MAAKAVSYNPTYWDKNWHLNVSGELCVHLDQLGTVRNLGFPTKLGSTSKGKINGVPNLDTYKFTTEKGHKVMLQPKRAEDFDGNMSPLLRTVFVLQERGW